MNPPQTVPPDAGDEKQLRAQQALQLFEHSLSIPAADRAAWLDQNCADPEVRAQVGMLQQADDIEDDFLATPSGVAWGNLDAGARIGPWRLDHLIADGGMGSVYMAHRDDGTYQQRVAIKFIHPLYLRADSVRRFEEERRILAQLQHPNIAQILDAGSTEGGLPYVVIEYVDGVPITTFCRERHLGVRETVDLFRGVCSAVDAAHRNLIVHRDLKPGNILVTADGRPMLLDFGIAKALEIDTAVTIQRETVAALTPDYASPEQIQGVTVTTSSDVYSLGVLLYELLAGQRPYVLVDRTPAQAEHLVCQQVPLLPSAARAQGDPSGNPDRRARMLRGDLDTIAMKALAKEPERRYGSVLALSEDLLRYLQGQPINARRDSVRYRMGKFIRRNRLAVAAACAVVALLIGGIVTTTWQAHRAELAAAEARAQQAKAETINEFYKNVFMSPSAQWLSSYGKGADVSIDQVLEFASRQADIELVEQPELQSDVLNTLSQAFQGMGLYKKAESNAKRALKVAQEKLPANHRLQAVSHYRVAQALYYQNDVSGSEKEYQRAIAVAGSTLAPDDEMTALMHNDLAVLLATAGRLDDAAQELAVALDLQRKRMHDKPYPAIAIGMGNLGYLDLARGRLADAEEAFGESLAMFAQLPGREYSETAYTLTNLSVVHSIRGEFQAAEDNARQALDIAARKMGHSHPAYATILLRHLEALIDLGVSDGVDEGLHLAEQIFKERLVPTHKSWASLEMVRARRYVQRGELGRAAESLVEARRILAAQPVTGATPKVDRGKMRTLALLGQIRLAQGNLDEARQLLEPALAMATTLYGPDVYEVRQLRAALEESRRTAPAHAQS